MDSAGRVLVVSPHPDDESIGCGGTLHQHVLAGDIVDIVFLTSGEKGGHGRPPEETARVRELEGRAAASILGAKDMEFWRTPDGALRASPPLVRRLVAKIRQANPRVIYVPHGREMHPDHQAAARLVRRAIRRLAADAAATWVPEVWMFEVWTPLSRIDQIVDISGSLDVKLAAVRAHKSQCEAMRFDDACTGLARYRGEMHCWPGGDYAEAYTQWTPSVAGPAGVCTPGLAAAQAPASATGGVL